MRKTFSYSLLGHRESVDIMLTDCGACNLRHGASDGQYRGHGRQMPMVRGTALVVVQRSWVLRQLLPCLFRVFLIGNSKFLDVTATTSLNV